MQLSAPAVPASRRAGANLPQWASIVRKRVDNEQGQVEPQAGPARRIAVVAVAVAMAAAILGGGIFVKLEGRSHSRHAKAESSPRAREIKVGDLEFTYSSSWRRADAGELRIMDGAPRGTRVVAAICATACGGVDVTYVLFGDNGADFFSLDAMERGFDATLRQRFTGFRRIGSSELVSADGIRYLRYEFAFTRGAASWHEVIAAYRVAGRGVVVMAQGPAADFAAHRDAVLKVMTSARLAA